MKFGSIPRTSLSAANVIFKVLWTEGVLFPVMPVYDDTAETHPLLSSR